MSEWFMFAGVHTFSNKVFRHLVEHGHKDAFSCGYISWFQLCNFPLGAEEWPVYDRVKFSLPKRNDLFTVVADNFYNKLWLYFFSNLWVVLGRSLFNSVARVSTNYHNNQDFYLPCCLSLYIAKNANILTVILPVKLWISSFGTTKIFFFFFFGNFESVFFQEHFEGRQKGQISNKKEGQVPNNRKVMYQGNTDIC